MIQIPPLQKIEYYHCKLAYLSNRILTFTLVTLLLFIVWYFSSTMTSSLTDLQLCDLTQLAHKDNHINPLIPRVTKVTEILSICRKW